MVNEEPCVIMAVTNHKGGLLLWYMPSSGLFSCCMYYVLHLHSFCFQTRKTI